MKGRGEPVSPYELANLSDDESHKESSGESHISYVLNRKKQDTNIWPTDNKKSLSEAHPLAKKTLKYGSSIK